LETSNEIVKSSYDFLNFSVKVSEGIIIEGHEEVLKIVEVGVGKPLSIHGGVDDGDDFLNVAPVFIIELGIECLDLLLHPDQSFILNQLFPLSTDVDELFFFTFILGGHFLGDLFFLSIGEAAKSARAVASLQVRMVVVVF